MGISKFLLVCTVVSVFTSGCVYESNFTCDKYRNAGKACTPASRSIEAAIENDTGSDGKTTNNISEKAKEIIEKELFIKCEQEEPCSYKPAPQQYVFVDEEARNYIEYKTNENSIKADELTNYSIKINTENVPVTTKPKTLRVTILPYIDEKGRLNMMKRVHLILQKPEWILGDYLIVNDNEIKLRD